MKTTYTITRYKNGWVINSDTGDILKNYNAVFEDPNWPEDERVAQADSLANLICCTFDFLSQTDKVGGLFVGCDQNPEEDEEAFDYSQGPKPLQGPLVI